MSILGFLTRPKEQVFQTAARDAEKKNAGAPVGGRQGNNSMLNVIQTPPKAQQVSDFIREGFVSLTAVQSNMVLRGCHFDGQRPIDVNHVNVLADSMRRGAWLRRNQLDFADCQGRLYLVNGYHRLSAQVATGETIEWTVVVHPCRDMDAVRALYYKFDTNVKARTAAQILSAIDFADKTGLTKQMAKCLYGALPVIASGFSKSRNDRNTLTTRSVDRRLEMAQEYLPAAKEYEKCLGKLPTQVGSKYRSGGVAAVALVTLRYQPILAKEFWSGSAANDGLRKGDPRLALHNDLLTRAMNAGSAVQSVFVPAYAWNAWFNDKPIKIIKVYATRRATIDGTPFEG